MNWFAIAGIIMLCCLLPVLGRAQSGTVLFRPLEMTALEKNDRVILNWKMERDTGASTFIVERSLNGNEFTEAARLLSKNRLAGANEYEWTDPGRRNERETVYYRIRQEWRKDSFRYSSTIQLKPMASPAPFELFPNPIHDQVTLRISSREEEEIRIRILDNNGRIRLATGYRLLPGLNSIILLTQKLGPGTYTLQVFNMRYALMGTERLVKN